MFCFVKMQVQDCLSTIYCTFHFTMESKITSFLYIYIVNKGVLLTVCSLIRALLRTGCVCTDCASLTLSFHKILRHCIIPSIPSFTLLQPDIISISIWVFESTCVRVQDLAHAKSQLRLELLMWKHSNMYKYTMAPLNNISQLIKYCRYVLLSSFSRPVKGS